MSATDRPVPNSAWWVYFVLLCGLSVLSLLAEVSSPLDFLLSILNLFALVGLWGYIRQVAVGWRPFWATYFVISVLLSAISISLNLTSSDRDQALFVILGFSFVLVLPLYLALWRYAFRSPAAWSAANA